MMRHLAVRSLRTNLRRYVAIVVAIVVAVAFLGGSLVLGDTLTANFRRIVGSANAANDVVIRSTDSLEMFGTATRRPIDTSIIDRLVRVPGVAAATPIVFAPGVIIGSDGDPIGNDPSLSVVANWIDDPALNAMVLLEGRAPRRDAEVVIDTESMRRGRLEVGDDVTVLTPEPTRFRVVGEARMTNDAGSLGGATMAKATLDRAQRIAFGRTGLANELNLRGRPGVGESELERRVAPLVPDGAESLTGTEQTEEILGDLNASIFSFLRMFLLTFAGVAIVAAALTIANCFAIVATQRTREMALLRSLGASRRQVLGSALGEAAILGVVASAGGLGLGVGLAQLLDSLIGSGLSFPKAAPVVTATTVVLSVGVGTVVTVLASAAPMVRMSRAAPIEALRGTAAEVERVPRRRLVLGGVAAAIGAALLLLGAGGWGAAPAVAGLGALMALVGGLLLAPAAAGVLARSSRGITRTQAARFARLNVARSPRRSASASAALTVGVAIVCIVGVLATSLVASVDEAVATGIRSDLVVTSDSGPLSNAMVRAMRARPELDAVEPYRTADAEVLGAVTPVGFVDASAVPGMLTVDGPGTTTWPDRLRRDEAVVSTLFADRHDLGVGSSLDVRFLDRTRTFRVAAIHSSSDFLGDVGVSSSLRLPKGVATSLLAILADAAPGVSDTVAERAANDAVAPLHGPTVRTAAGYADDVGSQIRSLLGIVYALLALSVFIALVGIGTSMSLSISERQRELSLLHAVGLSKGRLRSMVRWESAMIAALGSIGGVVLGVGIGAAFTSALSHSEVFGFVRIPGLPLLVIVVTGIGAGVVASFRPSRRAARLATVVRP